MTYPRRAQPVQFQSLEGRVLMAVTPSDVLTKPIRQALLDDLDISIKATLQSKLNADDLAGFDSSLHSYMLGRSSTNFFFERGEVNGIASYITSNIGDGGAVDRADDVVAHLFPEQTDSEVYTVQLPADIDWDAAQASKPEFLHALNRHTYWSDLSQAYRFTGDGSYVAELVSQLASWSQTYTTMSVPATWSATDQKSWLLDMGIRSEFWVFSYYQVLGASQWTKEANTLFLYKLQQHAEYLAGATTYGFADNRSLSHAKGWHYIAQAFPEFVGASTWQTNARTLLFNCLDGQFYNDGSHKEQSPGYASGAIEDFLECRLLDQANGNGAQWTSAKNTKLNNAINSYYQFLTPDGKRPALGDTYRISSVTVFLKANLVQGLSLPAAKPRGRDVWLFGTAAVNPYLGNSNNPGLGSRGNSFAMEDSGNYILRSGSDADARQISFIAGPRGGQHGHFGLLGFELFGYGKPLIADPGPFKYDSSASRAWAISTPAHNTISLDGASHGTLDREDHPGIVIDDWSVAGAEARVAAHHFGYDYLSGGPVVSRSLWYDYDGTILVVDWVEGAESHQAQTSFLLPTTTTSRNLAEGWIRTTNASGNVKIQAILQPGQAASYRTTGIFTSSNPPPNHSDPATQFFVYQTGSFVAFATLITAYAGGSPPDTSAQLLSTPAAGAPVSIRLTRGGIDQDITFDPPDLDRLDANATSRGSYSDLAYDKNGKLHHVFYDRDDKNLKYTARSTNGNWSIVETIDNGYLVGFDPSIAITSTGRVGVAYTNANNGDLKYAFHSGTEWTVETVDAKGSTGHYPSLAFSRGNGPVITYYDKTKGDLRMASSATSGWALSTIDSGSIGTKDVGRFSHLVLDPSRPDATKWAIAYEDTGGGRYLYAVQGNLLGGTQANGYTFFTVSASTKLGGYTSLAFDPSNRPHISYYDSAISGLRYAKSSGDTFSGVAFTASTVTEKGAVGYYSNLYFNASNQPTIFYFDKTRAKAMRVVFSSNKWNVTELAAGGREIHVARSGSALAYTNLDEAVPALKVLFL